MTQSKNSELLSCIFKLVAFLKISKTTGTVKDINLMGTEKLAMYPKRNKEPPMPNPNFGKFQEWLKVRLKCD